ncbi:MAG: twin-arginine translocase TatA/TatE family subunit, partial [Gemmatimonadota bacterium]|nr:twin-arginine translocase TatA/TatE family subunit [Gemmatimonadota bacterium]
MGGIGIEKIFLIGLVCLLLFGAKRLPEIGASLGKGIREFKGSLNELQSTVAETADVRPFGPSSASSVDRTGDSDEAERE